MYSTKSQTAISLTNSAFVTTAGESGGDIQLWGKQISLTDISGIFSGSFGAGKGGNLIVNASELVEASSLGSGFFTSSFGSGDGGDVTITTPVLQLRDGAVITTDARGIGNSGNLVINASELVQLSGDVLVEGEDMDTLFPSALRTDTFGKGDAGSLTVNTPVLIMEDGALISSSTFPGSSGFPGSTGDGGDITVVASESVQLSESRLTSQMGGEGDAGNVRINTAQLQLDSGGQIESGTLGEGDAGDILLQVEDSLTISGDFSGVFADTGGDSSGNGGSIIIDSKKVVVRDGGQIAVESQGTGDAGNLTVIAESIYLENGRLNAESANGRGGNIQLKVKDVLLLRGNSLISAFSGVEGNDGIDGNITIDTTFLIAIPNEDSDIVATGLGRSVGSNIQVNAQRIFGTQFRQQLTPDNDIVATGTVVLNTPDIDPTQDLAPLPITFIDMSNQVNNSCSPYGRLASGENKFIITGRGGIPASPSQSLNPEAIWEDWRFVDETEGTEPIQLSPRMINNESISGDKPRQIVEAQGWYRDAQGNVILTADSTMVTPHETGWNSANCLSEKP